MSGRAAVIGITWPIPEELDDTALERKLFAPAGYNPARSKPLPEGAHIHAELRRRGVTLALLWEEYRGHHLDGYGYSRFCDLYVEWRHGITATMRQTHAAGEKLFVDFAGDTVPVFDGLTGEGRAAKIFVAVMGASNYTFAQARFSEALPDWIGAHVDALTFLGGVPKAFGRDNVNARGRPAGLCWRKSRGGGAGGEPLRAGGQPDLPGSRGPLRHHHHAGAATQA